METKVRRIHADRLKSRIGFHGAFFVDGGGLGGGLALLWKVKNSLQLLSYSKNHVDVEVRMPDSVVWRLTCVYGFPERDRRHLTWDLLRSLRSNSILPWLVAGDFNEILSLSEKRGQHGHPTTLMEAFSKALDDCLLLDLGCKGRLFTWERGRGTDGWVEERLDRAVADAEWCSVFPHAMVQNIETLTSDHSAIFIDVERPIVRRRKRRFMFENAWLSDAGCKEVVEHSWQTNVDKTVPGKLTACSVDLRRWGGDLGKRLGQEISALQSRLTFFRGIYTSASLREIKEIDSRLQALLTQQHVFWRQRVKQHWLRLGYRNTKFFHHQASCRRYKNYISKLKDSTGRWCENEDLHHLITNYYSEIFSTQGTQMMGELDGFRQKLSQEDNISLLRPYTHEEIKLAVFSMSPDKAPGADGFNPAFFQHFWQEIGSDVSNFVIQCLHSRSFPDALNDSIITLVPKNVAPEFVTDLRPIALCNVLYKIMAKMVANRLKTVLDKIVDHTQSAFIPGRLITDNVLVASEVIHYLNHRRSGLTGWCALKLDMAKAYDRMEWVIFKGDSYRDGFWNGIY